MYLLENRLPSKLLTKQISMLKRKGMLCKKCMKLVQHANIVRLYEVMDTNTKLSLILELENFDMHDFIIKHENEAYLRMHHSSPTDDHVVQGHEHVLEYKEVTKRAIELRQVFRIAEKMADRHQFLETIELIASSIEAVGSY